MVARGFPRCKPNRIPDKMPEDKMLENKMSENGKPDKMPDNLTHTLTLTGSGPFMSLFTHTHYLSLSLSKRESEGIQRERERGMWTVVHTKSLLTQQFQSEAWDLICVYIIVHTLYIF